MTVDRSKVFISYSRKDSDFALKLSKDLKSNSVNVWLDQIDIPIGASWDDEIEKALDDSGKFLIILTPTSVASKNVRDELDYAIRAKKEVIPVLLEKCKVPMRIGRRQFVDFSSNYTAGLASLLALFELAPDNMKIEDVVAPRAFSRRKFLMILGGGVISFILFYFLYLKNKISPDKPLKKLNPRYKSTQAREIYQSDRFRNVFAINPKSQIVHYFDANGYTQSSKDFASYQEFDVFEKKLEDFDPSNLKDPTLQPRLSFVCYSWSVEQHTMELIRDGQYDKASSLLLYAIKLGMTKSAPSYRLFDLLAVLYNRHSKQIPSSIYEDLKRLSETSGDPDLVSRVQNWSNPSWVKAVREEKIHYFNRLTI